MGASRYRQIILNVQRKIGRAHMMVPTDAEIVVTDTIPLLVEEESRIHRKHEEEREVSLFLYMAGRIYKSNEGSELGN